MAKRTRAILSACVVVVWLLGTGATSAAAAAPKVSSAGVALLAVPTFTVGPFADGADDVPDGVCYSTAGNGCTLRAAIQEANASPTPAVIALQSGVYQLTLKGPGEDAAATGDLDVLNDLTIQGAGSGSTTIAGASGWNDRILDLHFISGGNVVISGVTISGGHVDGDGGGIRASVGHLTLSDMTLSMNSATGAGGGAFVAAALTATNVTISDNFSGGAAVPGSGGGMSATLSMTSTLNGITVNHNKTDGYGGGLVLHGPGASITNFTISRNEAGIQGGGLIVDGSPTSYAMVASGSITANTAVNGQGGGVSASDAALSDLLIDTNTAFIGGGLTVGPDSVTLRRSAVTKNAAANFAGGINDQADVGIAAENVTISDNTNGGFATNSFSASLTNVTLANNGLEINASFFSNTQLHLKNVIAAHAGSGPVCALPAFGASTIVSDGFNIATDGSCKLSQPSDRENTDPVLLPLADNGGQTLTHALGIGSPAIDAIPDPRANPAAYCPADDQRMVHRPMDGNGDGTPLCDIGAFENGPVNHPPVADPQSVTMLEDSALGITLTGTDPDGDALSYLVLTQPTKGTLSGTAPLLTYTPQANANGADSFSFKVNDGKLDSPAAIVTISITPVNDAPAGADKTVSISQDITYPFAAADFGFSDPNDSPANALLAVKLTTLPAAGSLTLNGAAVSAGQFVPAGQLNTLVFTPASGATGSPYASFSFQVQDDGGTANGGVDLDPTPKTVTFNVNARLEADLSLEKLDSPDPVQIGHEVSYTLKVINGGPMAAQNVVVSDPLPPATTFVSATGSGSYDSASNTVTWKLDSLANRAQIQVGLVVSVDRVCRAPSFVNTALVNSTTRDLDSLNNRAVQTTTILSKVGTGRNDTIVGTPASELILGLGGDDRLFGGGGNDVICGGPGNDYIQGGPGDDLLHGDSGNDTILGGAGNDLIFGDDGDDSLYGNDGNDQIWGGLGNDAIYGGPGADSLAGDQEIWVNGRPTADPADPRPGGSDLINGGAGDDLIYGQGGDDCFRALYSGCPNTRLAGADHNLPPELFGATGHDRIHGGFGTDRLDGGPEPGNILVGNPGLESTVADFCSFGPNNGDVRDRTCKRPLPAGTASVDWEAWRWPAA